MFKQEREKKLMPLVCNFDFPDEWGGFFCVCVSLISRFGTRQEKLWEKSTYTQHGWHLLIHVVDTLYRPTPKIGPSTKHTMWKKKVFYVWKNNRQRAACLHWHRNQFVMAFKATRFRFWRFFFLSLSVCVVFHSLSHHLAFVCNGITCLLLQNWFHLCTVFLLQPCNKMISVSTT